MLPVKHITLSFILLVNIALAQTKNEYSLTVSAKISNQGSGQKPGFRGVEGLSYTYPRHLNRLSAR
jgi:hypothetical protein